MKLRIYPKRETVLNMLESKEALLEKDLLDASTELDKVKESTLVFVEHESHAQSVLDALSAEYTELQWQIELVESHGPEEVMVELEIDG